MAKNKNKKNKKNANKNRDVAALFFALTAFISAYAVILPNNSGMLGKAFSNISFQIFGSGAYLIPIILLWYFIVHISRSLQLRDRIDFLWSVLSLISASIIFIPTKLLFGIDVSGGEIGESLYPFFMRLVGDKLGFLLLLIILIYSLTRLFRISFVEIIHSFIDDINKKNGDKENQPVIFEKKPEPLTSKENSQSIFQKPQSLEPNIVSKKEKERKLKEEKDIKKDKVKSNSFDYIIPPTNLLEKDQTTYAETNRRELLERAQLLKNTLAEFDIIAEVKDIIAGPVVTRYDLILAPGMKIQAISNIIDNISLTMRTSSIRVVPIPEKAAVGIEVPNPSSLIVGLRGILECQDYENSKSLLTIALGKTTDGEGFVTELSSMPHLLIAGATGSGKSVGIHTIILSILFKARPDEVKFMLIDPKRVEMPIYKDIPHLYDPTVIAANADIITNPREAAASLKKLVAVMDERYSKFAEFKVRNIEEYNTLMAETAGEKEFYIVVIIDELADLMLVAQKEIEDSIQRLAQMARAVGIHLILATQRPSVNVITGIIKANFPARLSFQTTSKIDSRVILDMLGAENLLGKGDMLFLPPGEARPSRLQGAYVSLKEAKKVIDFINEQDFPRIYEPLTTMVEASVGFNADEDKSLKDLMPALKLIISRRRVSQDLLKANFGSSARATNILSLLETRGFILKPEGTNKWQINFEEAQRYIEEMEG